MDVSTQHTHTHWGSVCVWCSHRKRVRNVAVIFPKETGAAAVCVFSAQMNFELNTLLFFPTDKLNWSQFRFVSLSVINMNMKHMKFQTLQVKSMNNKSLWAGHLQSCDTEFSPRLDQLCCSHCLLYLMNRNNQFIKLKPAMFSTWPTHLGVNQTGPDPFFFLILCVDPRSKPWSHCVIYFNCNNSTWFKKKETVKKMWFNGKRSSVKTVM